MTTLQTKVLIIGAGPTGLMMACQLARHKVPFIIIDQKKGITKASKALAVQARTMEVYQQMGIAQEALRRGNIGRAVNFLVKGEAVRRIHLAEIGKGLSPFPYVHILPQNENEALLQQFLGTEQAKVVWSTQLESFTQSKQEVEAIIIDEQGERQTIIADWLVGADGARSMVRKELGMAFDGDTNEQTFFVADSQVEWEHEDEELYVCLDKEDFLAFFPMRGKGRFRIIGALPAEIESTEDLVFEELIKEILPKVNINLTIQKTDWFQTYKIHHRIAPDFQRERCFLVGDSAHIHSPVGGQGMNTGLLDAYNLAWKLALVVQGKADDSLLGSYTEERLPFAKELVKSTDKAFDMIVSPNPIVRFFRLNIFPSLFKVATTQDQIREFAFRRISQIGISYKGYSINREHKTNAFLAKAPNAGDRFPYIETEDGNSFDWLTGTAFKVLYFYSTRKEKKIVQLKNYFTLAKIEAELLQFDKERNSVYFEELGIKEDALFIVRPDMYIGYRSGGVDLLDLEVYFNRLLGEEVEV